MTGMRSLCAAFCGVLSFVLLFSAVAFSQVPTSPPLLCIGGDCVATDSVALARNSGAIKWHPGLYVYMDPNIAGNGSGTGYSASRYSTLVSRMSAMCNHVNVTGYLVTFHWAALEGNTAGDYSKGFAAVDDLISRAAACGKKLMFRMSLQSFGNSFVSTPSCTSSSVNAIYPSYLCESDGLLINDTGEYWAGYLNMTAKLWEAPVMDRIIAMSNAYAARYDSNPHVEMVSLTGETSTAKAPNDALLAQLVRFVREAKPAWEGTQLRITTNYLGDDVRMQSLLAQTVGPGMAYGGPDVRERSIGGDANVNANYVWRGCNTPSDSSGACVAHAGWTNYQGKYTWVSEIQSPDYERSCKTCTPSIFVTYTNSVMQANYIIWYWDDWTGKTDFYYTSALYPNMIQPSNSNITNKSCPTGFANRCDAN